jgi:hypothetical protein
LTGPISPVSILANAGGGKSSPGTVDGDEMIPRINMILLACFACGAMHLAPPGSSARAEAPKTCEAPETGTDKAPIFSPPLGNVVIGVGRLQFYSAPNFRCPIDGIFVVPRDQLVAYALTDDGWTSVMYLNPRTGTDVSGWVRSDRLKVTGTEGPKW